jgi:hypothetical protein
MTTKPDEVDVAWGEWGATDPAGYWEAKYHAQKEKTETLQAQLDDAEHRIGAALDALNEDDYRGASLILYAGTRKSFVTDK